MPACIFKRGQANRREPVKALLLAGGLGTRLREETEFRPKPMVEIGGRPILWHIMKNLSTHGIHEFVIAVGYKGDMIKEYFLNYMARNNDFTIKLGDRDSLTFHGDHDESEWTVTIVDTGALTETGGRVLRSQRYLDDGPFLVTYGDGLADVDIAALQASHREAKCLATVTTVQPLSRFGVMEIDANKKVMSFREKPQLEGWVNIGFFIFEQEIFSYLKSDSVLERKPLENLALNNQLSVFQHNGFWQPMDTYREVQILTDHWNSGLAPWKTWNS